MSGVFIFGACIGAMLTAAVLDVAHDRGRAACEHALTRAEKCVQQWVPEAGVSK